jgi:uncharacterized protein
MRVLFFIDTHADRGVMRKLKEKAKFADLIVCGGDFTIFENDMDKVLHEFNDFGKPMLIIHGNHETSSGVMMACEQLKNLHFIHRNYYLAEDIVFFGFGGGGFSIRDESFTHEAEKFMQELKSISARNNKKYRLVLVTHAPPHGTKLDDIGEHVGNKNIKEFIEKYQPIIAMSGHIHENAGVEDKIGQTRIFNAGEDGMIIDL